ncbi:MAG TPA: hypothetical protein VN669_06140 [Candidatus Acidoferrales bacterium]|nr:hypothetical protein [Candidatus Acidoferrales bacterium]
MGVCADPAGVKLNFYDKDGKNQLRQPVYGKGLLHSLPRAGRLPANDPITQNQSQGSTDWLTDVMVADNDDELSKMVASSTGAAMTSTCSYKVRVQWKNSLAKTEIEENCVTLAVVAQDEDDDGERLPTKEIYVFPEGTNIQPGHPFWDQWNKTIQFLQGRQERLKAKV